MIVSKLHRIRRLSLAIVAFCKNSQNQEILFKMLKLLTVAIVRDKDGSVHLSRVQLLLVVRPACEENLTGWEEATRYSIGISLVSTVCTILYCSAAASIIRRVELKK